MKILCLIVILANICLFMWEYRNGAFNADNTKPEQQLIQSTEQILLIEDLKKDSTSFLPPSNDQPNPM
ncbi:MAG: hypothetical protein ABL884_09090 [Methyloglobulus sp.]